MISPQRTLSTQRKTPKRFASSMSLRFGTILMLMVWLTAGLTVRAQDKTLPRFEAADCPFQNYSSYAIDCGFVMGAEDHTQPDNGRTIKLAVAIIRSQNKNKAPDPVLHLAGGPGGAFVAIAPLMALDFTTWLENRDVILFDQRGMGLSEPRLSCPLQNPLVLFEADSSQPSFIDVMRDTGGLGACQERLRAAGIDTSLHNTIQNALDIGSIRQALGYEQVNLYGMSWSTRLALVALRENVPGIRSVIVDAVLPPDINAFETAPWTFDRAFTLLEKSCQADVVCSVAYPNLRQTYVETYERLSREPAQMNVDGHIFTMTADNFAGQVHGGLATKEAFQKLPGFIANMASENYEDVEKDIAGILQGIREGRTVDQGAFMTMACPEQLASTTLERIQAEEAKYPAAFRRPSLFFGSGGYYTCQAWGSIKTVPATPAVSDVPTLLLAGQFDPLTPPEWAHHAAATLSHSYVYELPGLGHVTAGDSCAKKLMRGFLADPMTAPDNACVGEMAGTNFVLSIAATRPVIQVGAVLLAGLLLYLLATMGWAFVRHPKQVAWRVSLKMMGWLPVAITAGVLALTIRDGSQTLMPRLEISALQLIIPLAMAIQAALVFAADEEPGLEMLLALPRPIAWIIVERLAVVVLAQTGIALAGIALTLAQKPDQDVMVLLISWIPSAVFLSGLALYITLRSRVMVFGALMAAVLWFIFALFGDFFLPGTAWPSPLNLVQPFLWAIHVHASPEDFALLRDYWLNRLFLMGAGMWFIWRGLREVRDEEYLLMSAASKQRRKTARIAENPVMASQKLKLDIMLRVVDITINPLHQIAGMAWYEFKMHWRRRAIRVITLTIILGLVAVLLLMGDTFTATIPTLGDISLLAQHEQELVRGLVLVMFSASMALTTMMLALPVVMADTVPLDKQQGMSELLDSLPVTSAVYLAGKLTGFWLAGLSSALIGMAVIGVLWWLRSGNYDIGPGLDLWLAVIFPLVILKGGLAVLIGAMQPNRRRAALAIIVVFIVTFALGRSLDNPTMSIYLNPVPYSVLMSSLSTPFTALASTPVAAPPSNLNSPDVMPVLFAGVIQLVIVWAAVWAWLRWKNS